jgi:hypothetical protein
MILRGLSLLCRWRALFEFEDVASRVYPARPTCCMTCLGPGESRLEQQLHYKVSLLQTMHLYEGVETHMS